MKKKKKEKEGEKKKRKKRRRNRRRQRNRFWRPFSQQILSRGSAFSHVGGCFLVLKDHNKVDRTQEISRTSITAIGSEYPTNIVCEHDFLGFAALK